MKIETTVSEKAAKELIASGYAAVRTIPVMPPSNRYLPERDPFYYNIRMFRDVTNFRPVIFPNHSFDRTRRYNLFTKEWQEREVLGPRGREKPNAIYSKKLSFSVLPKDGRMILFDEHQIGEDYPSIVLGCNIRQCRWDDSYCAINTLISNRKPWLDPSIAEKLVSVGLDGLIAANEALKSNEKPIQANECLLRANTKAFHFLAISINNLTHRLMLPYAKEKILKETGIDLPLFIITPTEGVSSFGAEQYLTDLETLLFGPFNTWSQKDNIHFVRATTIDDLAQEKLFARISDKINPENKEKLEQCATHLNLHALSELVNSITSGSKLLC